MKAYLVLYKAVWIYYYCLYVSLFGALCRPTKWDQNIVEMTPTLGLMRPRKANTQTEALKLLANLTCYGIHRIDNALLWGKTRLDGFFNTSKR